MYVDCCYYHEYYFRFDNLRIRRLKKTDAPTKGAVPMTTKKVGGRGKQDEKQAHLLFIAKIKIDQQQPPVVLKAISQAIYLSKCVCVCE